MLCIGFGLPSRTSTRQAEPGAYDSNEQPVSNTPVVESDSSQPKDGTMPGKTAPSDSYRCSSEMCQGTGLYDLQFHQLQDLLNQAAARLNFATITVNGIIDRSNTMPLVTGIANTGRVAGFTLPVDVAYDPQWIADNVSALIQALQRFLNPASYYSSGRGSRGWATTPDVIVDPGHGYVCTDGSIVADQSMCKIDTPTQYQCWDGTMVSAMAMCPSIPEATPPPMLQPITLTKPMKWGLVALGVVAGIFTAAAISR